MRKTTALLLALGLLVATRAVAGPNVTLYFPPAWDHQTEKANAIASKLSEGSGVAIAAKVAKSYPEILEAFESKEACLVYVGSFCQAIIQAKHLGAPLLQVKDGKEFYGSWMVYPKGQDPQAILRDSPAEVAYAVAASSGESGAKAATGGKASIAVASHDAAVAAVVAGKAKAAFVKNWWWKSHQKEFADFEVYEVPGVSDVKNPDNVLTGSKALSPEDRDKILKAALASKEVFGGQETVRFGATSLEFSLDLMKRGGISPVNYQW
ncbi:MAG: PhnD/SsuA/transferrin family substrate-binding protein [Deltaproteobacteria bacterium]|nr:PhnD/SsuA/transferrin family substrate-binding protein [Deltaproteobacteria bacterium]